MNEDRMECQICERQIKAKSGLIAHHGYTRPSHGGWGYQTASCAGARELPYEKSCALIPPYIKSMTDHKAMLERTLISYRETPPAKIVRRTPNPYRRGEISESTYDRPEGFTKENAQDKEFWQFKGGNYPYMYRKSIDELERAIKDTTEQITHLENRVKNWSQK